MTRAGTVVLVQGYFEGAHVPYEALHEFLRCFALFGQSISPPTDMELVRDLIVTRAGLLPEFYWQELPGVYRLCVEGDASPIGSITVDPFSMATLPPGLRGAFDGVLKTRKKFASSSVLHRVLGLVAAAAAQGLAVANLRGLPGAILVLPNGERDWRRVEDNAPLDMRLRIISSKVPINVAIELAVVDQLARMVEQHQIVCSRLQARVLDNVAPTEAEVAMAYGRCVQTRIIALQWVEQLPAEWLRDSLVELDAVVDHLGVMMQRVKA